MIKSRANYSGSKIDGFVMNVRYLTSNKSEASNEMTLFELVA